MERPVVKGAVRLDVVHRGAHRVRDPVQCTELVQDVAEQLVEGHVQGAASEAGEVPVANVRADRDVQFIGGAAAVQHRYGVPGMEAAGHVGAGDELEHRRVIAHGPGAEGLPEVSVQIHPYYLPLCHVPLCRVPTRGLSFPQS
jgi:hypothetical protein